MQEKIIEDISRMGSFRDPQKRREILFKIVGCPMDQPADYVFLSGCEPPIKNADIFWSLKSLLERFKVSYTFLSKEYCCGWIPLMQRAVTEKNQEKIDEIKNVIHQFLRRNLEQARALGAKGIVTVCAPCEPNYKNIEAQVGIDTLHYHEFLNRLFPGGRLHATADYYPGCVRFRRRVTQVPFDAQASLRMLRRIEGLELNVLSEDLCCYIPAHREQILAGIKTRYVITPCTGCQTQLRKVIEKNGECKVEFLTETLWRSILNLRSERSA